MSTDNNQYRVCTPNDDRYAFEVFRRAIVEQDEHYRHELTAVYDGAVRSWSRYAARGWIGDPDEMARLAWEKFWHNFTADKLLRAGTTARTLDYLKLCVLSVVLDAARKRASVLLPDSVADRSSAVRSFSETHSDKPARATLWQAVDRHLYDECERVLVHLRFELGLTPAEVQSRRPDLFPRTRDVYRVTQTVLDRLRQCRATCGWWTEPCG